MSNKHFKLPRKIKKALKKGMYLYPADKDENSQMAFPWKYQKDYDAYKQGILRNFFDERRSKTERKARREKLNKENTVTDSELKRYVDAVFREEYRITALATLKKAQNNPNTIRAYYNFINAYQLYEKGEDSYSNICCMCVDLAEKLLKEELDKVKRVK